MLTRREPFWKLKGVSLRCQVKLMGRFTFFLLLEVVGHADDYDTFFEEECAFEHQ